MIGGARSGRAFLLCEHASNDIPDYFGGLHIDEEIRQSHAAWDIGAKKLARCLAERFDAPLIAGTVSRLVYDLNRPPESPSAIVQRVEDRDIPGNQNLSAEKKTQRFQSVYKPFHDTVFQQLAEKKERNPDFALITIHSFTPIYLGKKRDVEIGILHDANRNLADGMLAHAHLIAHRKIERNQPYGPEDGVLHSAAMHGARFNIPHVMIEVRSDLLSRPEAVEDVCGELLLMLIPAMQSLDIPVFGAMHA